MTRSAFDAPGRWLKGNLHTHTTTSDGELSPQEAVDAYREEGYDFLAITDHNAVVDVSALDGGDMTLLPGIEIGAMKAELGQSIHLVGIGATEAPRLPESEQPQDFVDALNEVAELSFVAHPSWSSLTFADIVGLGGIIGLEVFNATCRRGIGRGTSEVQWDDCLVRGRRFFGLAVDDAHRHYDDLFGGWVMVRAPEATPAAIYEALKSGRFYATTGPTIENVVLEGQHLHVECSPCVEVFAVCPLPGRGWTNWRIGGGREPVTEVDAELRPNTVPIRVAVVDVTGKQAWTNMFWPDEP